VVAALNVTFLPTALSPPVILVAPGKLIGLELVEDIVKEFVVLELPIDVIVLGRVSVPVPAASVRLKAPVKVELKIIFPAPAPESNETAPVNVTALVNVMLSFVVVISPAVDTVPPPL
jgi:hypothetical protein